MFGGHRPFYKKQKTTCRQNEGRFSRGLSAPLFRRFLSILASILGGCWAPKSEKTRFGEVWKMIQKEIMRLTQKVTRVCTSQGGSLTSTHPGVPRPPPELPRPSQGRLKPYEHTSACLEGTVADYKTLRKTLGPHLVGSLLR